MILLDSGTLDRADFTPVGKIMNIMRIRQVYECIGHGLPAGGARSRNGGPRSVV